MLSRRHLRVKVLQALYAYFQSGEKKIDQGEKQLILSINKLYELFIYQLSFLIELTRFAENRIEDNKRKYLPTADDLNPNMRFVENRVLATIQQNKDFRKQEQLYKINWADEQEMIRLFYNRLRETDVYNLYMNVPEEGFEEDKKIVLFIITELFPEVELLESFYEEKSMYFVDDYHLVTHMLLNFFRFFDTQFNENSQLPPLLKTANDEVNEDLMFVKELFRNTILNSSEWDEIIAGSTSNWELERIAVMDVLILRMALTELTEFDSIPIKVSLNEYIEISKYFSTLKSRVFINGILDRLITEFKQNGRIKKTGRGLLDN
ncbi:MAG: transcription antitermination factor NusB [Bacteroidales bacterium]|jgi:N utilization substance protein B|nr:transcription antitermination factor NusB [Bacteroidales bacterium]MDD3701556.1 transcription antitermination factor NusB [Bacteroidales bacterium]MDY0369472.1 transcription antitermination factor NusB [Bacteroidales bacterium]